jgi:dihydrolipoamide dehydrogenase
MDAGDMAGPVRAARLDLPHVPARLAGVSSAQAAWEGDTMETREDAPLDVVIVGAGTAGLAAMREVRKRTDRFVLVNDGPYGTTCARVGCMPSKTLIAAADALHGRTRLDEFGIAGGEGLEADLPAVLARVRTLRDHFVAGVLETTADLGERSIAGRARLDGPNRVLVGGRALHARQIVLAPGSSPVVPAPWRALADRVLTTDTLFEQADLPPRIAVIGLGAIGVEIAQALARLGVEVHAFDASRHVAGLADRVVEAALRTALADEFGLRLGVEVQLEADGAGVAVVAGGERVIVDRVLIAVGRRPNVADLGLETLGVRLDERGMPPVDPETMRIGDTPVLLAGDANGDRPLLHEAADEGHIAGLNATSPHPVRLPRRTPLGIVFSDPGAATVGQRLADLDPDATLVGEAGFARQGRARTMLRNRGVLRIYASRSENGRILGAEMACPAAEHMAHLLALAIGQRLTVHDVLRMPFYHPTLEEGLRTALRAAAAQLPPCRLSDLAACGSLEAEALQ